MPNISVVLPTYNEVGNIVTLLVALQKVLKKNYEIIVVDDNSPDGTSRVVAAYIKKEKSKHIHLETRLHNPSLARSIEHGIRKSKGDIVIWMDCDFSMPPELIPKLIKKIEEGYDIAIGSRFVSGGEQKKNNEKESALAIILSTALNSLTHFLLGSDIQDLTSGFVAIRKYTIMNLLPLRGDYGEYCIDLLIRAKRNDMSIIEVPFVNLPRRLGESKTLPNGKIFFTRIWQYGTAIIRLLFERI